MAQRWQQGAPVEQSPQQGMGGWYSDPFKESGERRANADEARKNEDQGFERTRLNFEEKRLGFQERSEARQADDSAQGRAERRFSNIAKMRDDFKALPEVKEYNVAMQQLDQALRTGDGPQGDLALTYAFAKAMDPGSVVRDSEQAMQSNSQPWFQSAVEAAKKQFGMDGAGTFTPEARQRLRDQIISSVGSRRQLYQQARDYFTDLSGRYNFDPYEVVGRDTGTSYADRLKEYGGNAPLAAGLPAAPSTSTGGGNTGGAGNQGPYQNDPSGNRTFLTERDKAFAAEAQAAFQNGADRQQLDAIAQKYGAQPFGADLDAAIESRRRGAAFTPFTPTATGKEEAGLTGSVLGPWAQSGLGSYAIGAGNAVTAGQLGNLAGLTGSSEGGTDVALSMAKSNALPYFGGELVGGALGVAATGAGLTAGARAASNPTVASLLANPITADVAYGSAYGAGQADDPLYGAVGGGLASLGGSYLGGKVGSLLARARGPADALNRGERAVFEAINKTGATTVEEALQNASNLGVPLNLADVSPDVNSLTGAAIRRSASGAGRARDFLSRRSAGQIDRFRGAVERDLGPLDNVPQRSADLIAKAQADASPFYAEAYAAPVISTPTIDELLNTPFGKQALSRANTIAANERRNPQAMGFSLDANGDVVLNPLPVEHLAAVGQAEANAFAAEQALKRAQTAQLTGAAAPGTGGGGARYTPPSNTQTVTDAEAAFTKASDALKRAETAQLMGAGGPNVNDARAALESARVNLEAAKQAQLSGGIAGGVYRAQSRPDALLSVRDAEAAHEAARTQLQDAYAGLNAAPTVGTAATIPGYTTQTLDYVKRGMDDVLEQYRNPITGKLELDEAGKAENSVLRSLLNEVDQLNPAYGQARGAYAGPASEQEALRLGQGSLTQNPDLLTIQANRMTPTQLEQMQLGGRDSLVKSAERVRNNSNPFAILNSPAMEQRISALYPNAGDEVSRLLAQRDLELQMAGSTNRLIGNSMTAERGIADQAFLEGGIVRPLIEGGIETAITGAPVATAMRSGLARTIADRAKMGVGKKAEEKADQIITATMQQTPDDAIAAILAMTDRNSAYQAALQEALNRGQRYGSRVGSVSAASATPFWMGD